MNTFKLILRYLAWFSFCIISTIVINALLNISDMDNKFTGVVAIVMVSSLIIVPMWLVHLRKDYKTLDEVVKDFPVARTVTKDLLIFLFISQFFFHIISVASIHEPYTKIATKYENSETFLVESFGTDESTLDFLKVFPKQGIEYILYTGNLMHEVLELTAAGEDTSENGDRLLAEYEATNNRIKADCFVSLFWCGIDAAIYTFVNRIELYHQSIKYVKENKRNGRKHVQK